MAGVSVPQESEQMLGLGGGRGMVQIQMEGNKAAQTSKNTDAR